MRRQEVMRMKVMALRLQRGRTGTQRLSLSVSSRGFFQQSAASSKPFEFRPIGSTASSESRTNPLLLDVRDGAGHGWLRGDGWSNKAAAARETRLFCARAVMLASFASSESHADLDAQVHKSKLVAIFKIGGAKSGCCTETSTANAALVCPDRQIYQQITPGWSWHSKVPINPWSSGGGRRKSPSITRVKTAAACMWQQGADWRKSQVSKISPTSPVFNSAAQAESQVILWPGQTPIESAASHRLLCRSSFELHLLHFSLQLHRKRITSQSRRKHPLLPSGLLSEVVCFWKATPSVSIYGSRALAALKTN